ncbi:adenylate/guanylate cyclase domain-containing protein [Myxococcus llanfairpwllgwyngyllgogerychwyrndrobwllllantysiliogogogochensis]|uniref:Adenylate/guanylate cyclase domain-containing protein n=2 Tax=Myxococcus llanfairpwllgwyngyllgogerychwyrndrobwllllantysiliogogogochensis TaxID=2590453 RepID=A0A540X8C9_9BACT|nr:adenylate/guanylate cyclase domain-containing protein [Myxococcus llanfairpwllgwyngyllgogerychwyrndrobwllllantysiliogogogochensis]
MTLTRKLVLAFMALAGAALVAALVLTTLAVEAAAKQKIASDLERTLVAFQQLARASQERIRDVAEARTMDHSFRGMSLSVNSLDAAAGLGDETAETDGIRYAREVISSADTDAFGGEPPWAFFNASGRLVYTRAEPEQLGDQPLALPLLDTALRRGPTSALWSPAQLRALPFTFIPLEQVREGDLLLVHAQPAYGASREPVGVVLSGQWVKDVLMEDPMAPRAPGPQMADTRASFAVRAEDGATASQLPLETRLDGPELEAGQARDVYLGDTHYLVREGTLLGVDGARMGQVFVLRDFDAEIKPILRRFRLWLVPTAVGIALFALAAAFFLARGLASPLVRLEEAAGRVRLGDLTVEVPVRGTDEVGRVAQAFNEMVSGLRQRDQIKGLFKRYLAPQVVDELLKNPEKAAPGGERKLLTVLFSDLVGFTSMSEQLSPEELVALLNTYFEQATGVLTQHGATLDKFIGDAIMCFWNAPLPLEDHAARACLTALDLLAVVDRLSPVFEARGLPRLDCRIGINTGHAVAGNLGSSAAQDYTVIGDTVNLASRLEGAAKVYGTRTLVAEDTLLAARGVVLARELDLLRVKGKQQPVRVFELVGVAGTSPAPHLVRFAEGLALYRARRFTEARAVFLASPEDPPSQRFAARCDTLLVTPPPEDWDGVFTLDSK